MSEKKDIKTFVIVNPVAAGGAVIKRWPRICDKLVQAIGKFEYEFTTAEGDAALLSKKAVNGNFEKIIAVGGDGTLHEIIQGLFSGGALINPEVILGTIPMGTGTDFARTLKIHNDIDDAIFRLRGKGGGKIDLGRVEFMDQAGNMAERYLLNMADVGLGGEVARRANNSMKVLGGFATYLYSSVISFASYKSKHMRIESDKWADEQDVTSVFVANGEFFGGGMHVAPDAAVNDGLFDVIIVGALSKWDIVPMVPKIYSGKLHLHPAVRTFKTKNLLIESDEEVLVNIDGEQPGKVPVNFSLVPKAVQFMY